MRSLHRNLLALFRRARRPAPARNRATVRLALEPLEGRLTPATLTITATGDVTYLGSPGEVNHITLTLNPTTNRYEFTDTSATITAAGAGSGAGQGDAQGSGTNTVTVRAPFVTGITINTGDMSDFVTVRSTAVETEVTSTGGVEEVNLGGGNVQGITGKVFVVNEGSSSNDVTDLTIDDSADTVGRPATISDSAVTGLAPGDLTYRTSDIDFFTVNGGSGGNRFTVTNSIFGSGNFFNLGSGNDTLTVQAAANGSTLVIDGQGGDDHFDITPSPSVEYRVNGGPATTASPGNALTFHGPGTVASTGPGQGTITADNLQKFTFQNLMTVTTDLGTAVVGTSLQFSNASFFASESGNGATITVTRAGNATGAVAVTVSTAGGTATPNTDFTPISRTVSWASGDVSPKTVIVPIGNTGAGGKTIGLLLSNPTGGAFIGPPGGATLTILSPPASFIVSLYRTVLQRDPDPSGLANWQSALQLGTSRLQIAQAFWESAEHRALEVTQFYASLLHRAVDPTGMAFWTRFMQAGHSEKEVYRGIVQSTEYLNLHLGQTNFASSVFTDLVGRAPNAGELQATQQVLSSQGTRAVIDILVRALEADARWVDQDYAQLLGRAGDAAGRQFWANAINRAGARTEAVSEAFLASDEFFARAQATV
jgi:Domain of unknown function (DUF4214)/Calx-beta domain